MARKRVSVAKRPRSGDDENTAPHGVHIEAGTKRGAAVSDCGVPDWAEPLRINEGGEVVLGRTHPHPNDRVCVHILAPFGQCAVDCDPSRLDSGQPHEDLLRRLYQVCLWAERQSAMLVAAHEEIRQDLVRDPTVIGPQALSDELSYRAVSAEHLDKLSGMHDKYETVLHQRALRCATAQDCPHPEVAASCWEFLAMNEFFADQRHPIVEVGAR